MPGPDIFISYCRQDRASARLFAESFAEEGFNVWWDAVMHSGETFDEVIERELRASTAVVVLWSPRSVASRWVRAEATQADRANKLVPVKIEACELPIIFELTHTADLPEWKGDRSDASWQSLVKDLRRLIGPSKAKAEQVTSAPVAEPEVPVAEAKVAEEPASPAPAPKAKVGKEHRRPTQQEVIEALERLAKPKVSPLHEPTPEEEAKAKFFQQSDDFRANEHEMVHCLRRLHVPDSEALHLVGPAGVKIGRAAPADIIVFEPGVSRAHCVVEFAADKLRVLDLNSTNGTYIDDKRISSAEILPVGSVLRVGNISFEHEVRSRAELQPHVGLPGNDLGTGPRAARFAR